MERKVLVTHYNFAGLGDSPFSAHKMHLSSLNRAAHRLVCVCDSWDEAYSIVDALDDMQAINQQET